MADSERPSFTGFHARFALVPTLAGYRLGWLRNDLGAGLAVAAVALPIALAYPALAGLSPQTGFYASIASLLAYAAFGSSRRLMVGPDAATLTVLAGVFASILVQLPGLTADQRAAAAALIAIGAGVICLLGRVLGIGALANFLSRPILTGFFAGISLTIMTGQIGRLTGLHIDADGIVRPVVEMLRESSGIHWVSVFVGLTMFAILEVARVARSPVPGPVIVVVAAIVLSALLGLEARGVAVVGDLPAALPALGLPGVSGLPLASIALGSAAVAVISFGSGIITARSFAARTDETVDSNRELIGFGAANIACGLAGGFPVTGAASRTAVNISSGGRSQVSGLVAAGMLVLAIVYLGPVLRILPLPALGAILFSAAVHMIDFRTLAEIRRISRIEFAFAMMALVGPIAFGVLQGVAVAIVVSLVHVIHKGMHPRVVQLGRIPGRAGFFKLHRHADARPAPGVVIVLIEGDLLFFAVDNVKSALMKHSGALDGHVRWVIFDAGVMAQIDTTGAAMLHEANRSLAKRGVRLALSGLHHEVRQLLDRAGVTDAIGKDMVFDNLDEALRAFEAQRDTVRE
ncbi:MAG: SulP family inorganic anion transporter [Phycisphaeraceae bacterium]|nr:SulP family inorganic anion transporter [Phycisphaeraceae bacterium]